MDMNLHEAIRPFQFLLSCLTIKFFDAQVMRNVEKIEMV